MASNKSHWAFINPILHFLFDDLKGNVDDIIHKCKIQDHFGEIVLNPRG